VCGLVEIERSSFYYRENRSRDDGPLTRRLKELAKQYNRWGCPQLYDQLRFEGWKDNHKRIERIYAQEGLQLKRRRKKKLPPRQVEPLDKPTKLNEVWSMDFLHDQYGDGHKLKLLPIEDLFSLECLWVEVDRSMSGAHVTRVLDRVIEQRGKPSCIQTDNGPEFTSRAFCQWARRRGIKIHYIDPGKPTQNAYIESLNGTLRYECLDAHWFSSLEDAREQVESWRYTYNWVRSHSSLGRMPPSKFAKSASGGSAPTSMRGPFSRSRLVGEVNHV
jgi:putative transposase